MQPKELAKQIASLQMNVEAMPPVTIFGNGTKVRRTDLLDASGIVTLLLTEYEYHKLNTYPSEGRLFSELPVNIKQAIGKLERNDFTTLILHLNKELQNKLVKSNASQTKNDSNETKG